MPSFSLTINGEQKQVDVPADMPLLWVLRDMLNLTGTKYGCGVGSCGGCTVLVEGKAMFSCLLPMSFCSGKKITTIEGLSADANHPVQIAWQEINVPQCGFCQPGQIMAAVDLLQTHPQPTDEQIDEAMGKVVCRCGTYYRIRKAIHKAAELMHK